MNFDKFMGLIQRIKDLDKCSYCKKLFNQKQRFINIIKNTPRDDYKEMIGLSDFCSNECVEKDKHIDDEIKDMSEEN